MFEAICVPQAKKVTGSNVGSHITQELTGFQGSSETDRDPFYSFILVVRQGELSIRTYVNSTKFFSASVVCLIDINVVSNKYFPFFGLLAIY